MRLIDILVDLFLGHIAVAVHLGKDSQQALCPRPTTACPPQPGPVAVTSLPLPPVIKDWNKGSCNFDENPSGTGCIGQSAGLEAGSFLTDENHVLATVKFAGASEFPDPRSVYSGQQVVVIDQSCNIDV
ncbi:hypothetical protein AC579_155 [Pseudocercospora musae]|uniref:Uncharacterized protein n=1 Tax=Pseudocercospora musae TaxID=113226 RepID=A0A139IAD2_9PEZI|nr:hypothetical protein AC579_155 [Pseudocercospora musae]